LRLLRGREKKGRFGSRQENSTRKKIQAKNPGKGTKLLLADSKKLEECYEAMGKEDSRKRKTREIINEESQSSSQLRSIRSRTRHFLKRKENGLNRGKVRQKIKTLAKHQRPQSCHKPRGGERREKSCRAIYFHDQARKRSMPSPSAMSRAKG